VEKGGNPLLSGISPAGASFLYTTQNNSLKIVILSCTQRDVTGVTRLLHEHILNKRSILACHESGPVCLNMQAVQLRGDLCIRGYHTTYDAFFHAYERAKTATAKPEEGQLHTLGVSTCIWICFKGT